MVTPPKGKKPTPLQGLQGAIYIYRTTTPGWSVQHPGSNPMVNPPGAVRRRINLPHHHSRTVSQAPGKQSHGQPPRGRKAQDKFTAPPLQDGQSSTREAVPWSPPPRGRNQPHSRGCRVQDISTKPPAGRSGDESEAHVGLYQMFSMFHT